MSNNAIQYWVALCPFRKTCKPHTTQLTVTTILDMHIQEDIVC